MYMLKAPTLEKFSMWAPGSNKDIVPIKTHLPIIIFFLVYLKIYSEVLYQLWQMVLMGNYKDL